MRDRERESYYVFGNSVGCDRSEVSGEGEVRLEPVGVREHGDVDMVELVRSNPRPSAST